MASDTQQAKDIVRTVALADVGMGDLDQVGGKNASLGEMIKHLSAADVRVPGGFATTSDAFWEFLAQDDLEGRIQRRLADLDVEDVDALAAAGAEIRGWVAQAPLPPQLEAAIDASYAAMADEYADGFSVAVRSSATAEDLPEASFAGQQETFLNVRGLDDVKARIRDVFASLFNDRAISYRVHQGFSDMRVALSAGIQKMVRSDLGASGVMFTLDTESGFRDVVFVTSSYGLGELVVQGAVNPDEFYIYKPALAENRRAVLRRNLGSKLIRMAYAEQASEHGFVETLDVDAEDRSRFSLTDAEIEELGRIAMAIEKHYGRPMDIEWAKDGEDQRLYIVQARPETVRSHDGA